MKQEILKTVDMLADRLGELDSDKRITSWQIRKIEDKFQIILWLGTKDATAFSMHSIQTGLHRTLLAAIDEAIDLFRTHTADCSLC